MSLKQYRSSPSKPKVVGDNSTLLKEVIGACKICGSRIAGHQYAHIGTAPISAEHREFDEMLEAVKQEGWTDVVRFQHWEPLLPDAEVVMFRCEDNRTSVAIILCPFELEEPYLIMYQQIVSDDSYFQDAHWLIV